MVGINCILIHKMLQLLETESNEEISDHQWLQFDLGPATQVTGMVTRGQGDRKRFVTSYTMAYSNDSVTWHEYKDSNHLEAKVSLFAPLPMQYDQFVVRRW